MVTLSSETGKIYVSATWRKEFQNYNSYVLDVPESQILGNLPKRKFEEYLSDITKYSFANGFIAQEFCEFEGRRFVAWGKFWTGEDARGSGRIYELTEGSWSTSPRLVAKTSDYRFRDCSFGKAYGKNYLAAVTQGDGYLIVREVESQSNFSLHIPFYGKHNNKVTTMHFVDFADLDGDGNHEIYLTATTPEFGRFWNNTGYQEWTIFQVKILSDGTLSEAKDIWALPDGTFVKRIKSVQIGKSDAVLVWAEWRLSEDGKSASPFIVYAYYGTGSNQIEKKEVLQIPNKECKEFTAYFPLGKDVPSFQLGCDNWEVYVYRMLGADGGSLKMEEITRISINDKVTDNYSAQRDVLTFWDVIQTHALFGKDFNSDGRDELIVWVNNTGLYRIDFDESLRPSIEEIFHIERVFPEPVGRLMIFSITDTPESEKLPQSPLFESKILN